MGKMRTDETIMTISKAPPSPTGGILLAEKIFTSAKKSTSYEKKTN